MPDEPRTSEPARTFVLVIGLIAFAIAGALFFMGPPGSVIIVGMLAAVGVIFVGLFAFGSTKACQVAMLVITLGVWWPK